MDSGGTDGDGTFMDFRGRRPCGNLAVPSRTRPSRPSQSTPCHIPPTAPTHVRHRCEVLCTPSPMRLVGFAMPRPVRCLRRATLGKMSMCMSRVRSIDYSLPPRIALHPARLDIPRGCLVRDGAACVRACGLCIVHCARGVRACWTSALARHNASRAHITPGGRCCARAHPQTSPPHYDATRQTRAIRFCSLCLSLAARVH